MRVTKWGEYGILCCLYLAYAKRENSVGASELAEFHSIPLQYAQQILQRLRKGGIINSVRGPGGGYRLARDPEKINLKDILYATEGCTFDVICDSRSVYLDICDCPAQCALHNTWNELRDFMEKFLEKKTLASMLKTHKIKLNGNKPSGKSSNTDFQSFNI